MTQEIKEVKEKVRVLLFFLNFHVLQCYDLLSMHETCSRYSIAAGSLLANDSSHTCIEFLKPRVDQSTRGSWCGPIILIKYLETLPFLVVLSLGQKRPDEQTPDQESQSHDAMEQHREWSALDRTHRVHEEGEAQGGEGAQAHGAEAGQHEQGHEIAGERGADREHSAQSDHEHEVGNLEKKHKSLQGKTKMCYCQHSAVKLTCSLINRWIAMVTIFRLPFSNLEREQ